jgi:hypothetical protein
VADPPRPRRRRAARQDGPARSGPGGPESKRSAAGWGIGGRSRRRPQVPPKVVTSVIDGLKAIYFQKVRPLEEAFRFSTFFGSQLMEGDFEAKPSVLLMGQYSTGKTTFIKVCVCVGGVSFFTGGGPGV